MKILHVIPSISLNKGGPSLTMVEMVRALRRQGVDAEIATIEDGHGNDYLENSDVKNKIFRFKKTRLFPGLNEFAFSWSFVNWLSENITKYDLLHIHAIFSFPSTIAMLIARFKKVPYVLRPLGQLCRWAFQYKNLKKKIYWVLVERDNVRQAKGFHLMSDLEAEQISDFNFETPEFVIPHGIEAPSVILGAKEKLKEILKIPGDPVIFTCLSRLHPIKGFDLLIPSFKKAGENNCVLLLAGEGRNEFKRKLNQWIEAAGVERQVWQLGFAEGELKELLIQGSDFFILTSYSENFGYAVLEALAAGKPALVTEGVGLADVIRGHNLGCVVPADISSIVDGIMGFVRDRVFWSQEEGRIRQFIRQNYDWGEIAMRIREMYDRIVAVKQ